MIIKKSSYNYVMIMNKKVGDIMNDLLERYLGAVCSYFIGPKRKRVYNELKKELQSSAKQYDDLEALLIQYGHPRSVALSYGYRPCINHIFNTKMISKVEKRIFTISFIFLFFSTLYYLQQLNCLPFQSTQHVASTLNTSTTLLWLLSHPIIVMMGISLFSLISLYILDRHHPTDQNYNLEWNQKKLLELPHPSRYPTRIVETCLMIIFIVYFFIYTLFFNSSMVLIIQHSSYQMIHLMTYFFQPFIMIIILDCVIDMTKKTYTKKYLKYSSFINLFTILSLTIFIINSQFLKNYLLPFDISIQYTLFNILILGALFMISFISIYKLIRNIKSYQSLFKK